MNLPLWLRALIIRILPDHLLEDRVRRELHEADRLDIRQPDPWWALLAGTRAEARPLSERRPQ